MAFPNYLGVINDNADQPAHAQNVKGNSPAIGYAYAAGDRHRNTNRNSDEVAARFSLQPDRLVRCLEALETEDHPGILLLQYSEPSAEDGSVVYFSSAWSKAYERFGTPYGKVHRDFHYQCLFMSIATLVEIGCEYIVVDNPMSGYMWRRDAYICLAEALENIRRYMNGLVTAHLTPGSFNARIVKKLDEDLAIFNFQKHRPVGISPHFLEGLNMRTVFVEKAEVALQNKGVVVPMFKHSDEIGDVGLM
jgi:hypothetical protein